MYLLDTNVLSELVRKHPDPGVTAKLRDLRYEDSNASIITLFELRYGAMRRADGADFWRRIQQQIVPATQWLEANFEVAQRAGDITAELEASGIPIGTEDVLIGATAMQYSLVVVTRKTEHFSRIPGLRVENWFSGET
jgi:tRNA(fMet)-specific endonuclease VapC